MKQKTTYKCKGCDKKIPFGNYHKKCYKTRMISDYVDPKMDPVNYPVKYIAPMHDKIKEDQYRDLFAALGTIGANQWIKDNAIEDIDMEDIFHKIMEGDIDYA